jgi:hypothetical protein
MLISNRIAQEYRMGSTQVRSLERNRRSMGKAARTGGMLDYNRLDDR